MSSGPCCCLPELKCSEHKDKKYVLGFDPVGKDTERTVIQVSDIGYFDIDAMKNILFVPMVKDGADIFHWSIDKAELGDPDSPDWWDRLLKAIEKRVSK